MKEDYMNEKNLLPSNKNFGFFISIIIFLVSFYLFLFSSAIFATLILFFSLIIFFISIKYSRILSPLNIMWFKIGMTISKFVNPIIISLIFFLVVSPIAILSRVLGRDELKIKKKKTTTYWIRRKKTFSKNSFFNQY